MHFIPSNRIVTFSWQALQIFGIVPSENESHHSMHALYTIPLSGPFAFSDLFRSPHFTSKMVVFVNDEVNGIEIPDSDPTATVISKIGDQNYPWKKGARAAAGHSTGVIAHKDGTMDLLSFSWGQGSDVTFDRTSCSSGPSDFEEVLISSDLGRIVTTQRGSQTKVLDCERTACS